MNIDKIQELLDKVAAYTGVKDIACHRIADGKLHPVLKTETDALGMARWKEVHASNPIYIKNDSLLTELLQHPGTVILQDVKNDPRSQEEFFLFGIDSIMIVPYMEEQEVVGLVIAASIGSLHEFTPAEAEETERLVALYREDL